MMNVTIVHLQKRIYLLLLSLTCILILHPLLAIAESVSYQYDSWHRLTNATYENGVTISYTYDAVGNRLIEDIATTSNAAAFSNDQATLEALNAEADTTNTSGSKVINTQTVPDIVNTTSSEATGVIDLNDSSSLTGIKNKYTSIQANVAGNGAIPHTVVYENADDGTTKRWILSDGPLGAYVDNVYDSERDSRVIEVNGDGLLNGFWLVKNDETWWNDSVHKVIQWSMKYSNDFVISIATETSNGLRYVSFTPDETDSLATDTDVFYGLGANSKDGRWHTYYIDLDSELHEAQPNTTILSLLGFYVRGTGQVDDILTLTEIPATLDTNGDVVPDIQEIEMRNQSAQ